MLTYQVRPRVFRHEPGEELVFPAQCEIRFHFRPRQPFGLEPGGGRTAVRAVAAEARFNANTGQHTVESKKPLTQLDVRLREPIRTIQWAGNVLIVRQQFETLAKLKEMIESVYFGLPMLLNVSFADPPYIERVDGSVGSSGFRWELSHWNMEFRMTTQEKQEAAVVESWKKMGLFAEGHRRRLLAGLHYFHVACRLSRQGSTAGEFVAEVVLNLAKTLEVLFPPEGDGRSRDAARSGLAALRFSQDEVEGNFIPALALRNEIDVAHVELGLFTVDQLKVIHAFTERAEAAFREMFDRLLARIEAGEVDVAPHTLASPRSEAVALIERLRQHTAAGLI